MTTLSSCSSRVTAWIFTRPVRGVRLMEPDVVRLLNRMRNWRFGPDAGRMLTSAKSMVRAATPRLMAGNIGMYGPVGPLARPEFPEDHGV